MRWLVGMALAVGLGLNLTALWLWWVAALHGWRVTLVWNEVGEQWVEGVGLHAGIGLLGWALWKVSNGNDGS